MLAQQDPRRVRPSFYDAETPAARAEQRRGRLLQELSIRSAVAVVIVAFQFLTHVTSSQEAEPTILGLSLFALLLSGPYYLAASTGRWSRAQAYVRMLIDIGLITAGLYCAGGLGAAHYLGVYLIVPIYAGIVFSSTACLVATGSLTASYVAVVALQHTGWLAPPPIVTPNASTVAAFNLTILNIAGGLTALLAHALRRSRQRLRATYQDLERFIETIPDIFYVLDRAGTLVLWNRRLEATTGLTAGELRGRPLVELCAEDERPVVAAALEAGMTRGQFQVDGHLRAQDGVLVAHHWTGAALRDEHGQVLGLTGVGRDMTERNQAAQALRERESELRQLQRIEAVGRLAGGVAHDFNNLLTVIIGRSQLLQEQSIADERTVSAIRLIEQTAQRAAALTRQLLTFSRKQSLEPTVLDVNEVVRDITDMLRHLIGENIDLRTTLATDLRRVKADPAQLEQVIVNLVVNARDAMPSVGCLIIWTSNVDLTEAFVLAHPGAAPGPHVLLTVSDTGLGMDEATRQRIFEPFFTTKEPGKGTGLGLSTVYGIVKQHGGHIVVETTPGRGTTFRIYLPAVDSSLEPSDEGTPRVTVRGHGTVLLVEDEADVRNLARDILERYGYRVLVAARGSEALTVSARHRGPIHVLLTDVVMPEMSGPELAERLTTARPDTRVLYMSGYSEVGPALDGRLLQKPFTPDALVARVGATIDGLDGGLASAGAGVARSRNAGE